MPSRTISTLHRVAALRSLLVAFALSALASGCILTSEEPRFVTRDGAHFVDAPWTDAADAIDTASADVVMCPPDLSPPRQIAPLATATVTLARPTLRWELSPRTTGARVEVCDDPECNTVTERFSVIGTSGRPLRALAPGLHYWRVRSLLGRCTGSTWSPTWAFWVRRPLPTVSDPRPDTSWGSWPDLNRDGFADVLVAAESAVYLYFGSSSRTPPSPMTISISAGLVEAQSIASAGDVNGDGFSDVIVGTVQGVVMIYGGASITASAPEPTPRGATLVSVGGVGDVNGDGYADVGIGVIDDGNPSVMVFQGSPRGLDFGSVWSELFPPSGAPRSRFGLQVASAGDVNGDGYADVLVGAPAVAGSMPVGRAYIFHGSNGGPTTMTILSDDHSGPSYGSSVGCAGDVNRDGYADVVVGDPGNGVAFLHYGGPPGATLLPPERFGPESGLFGASVDGAGDVDNDGYDDIICGAPRSGKAAIVFGGTTTLTPQLFTQSTLLFGRAVVNAGDVNGDGIRDTALTAAGFAYVYMGHANRSDFLTMPGWTLMEPYRIGYGRSIALRARCSLRLGS